MFGTGLTSSQGKVTQLVEASERGDREAAERCIRFLNIVLQDGWLDMLYEQLDEKPFAFPELLNLNQEKEDEGKVVCLNSPLGELQIIRTDEMGNRYAILMSDNLNTFPNVLITPNGNISIETGGGYVQIGNLDEGVYYNKLVLLRQLFERNKLSFPEEIPVYIERITLLITFPGQVEKRRVEFNVQNDNRLTVQEDGCWYEAILDNDRWWVYTLEWNDKIKTYERTEERRLAEVV